VRDCAASMPNLHSGPNLRIGLIGLGPWGQNLARAFGTTPRCELVAVCDARSDRLCGFSKGYRGRRESNAEAVLGDTEIDAIVVATGAENHYPLAKRALEAEKHVFVEKPMTLSAESSLELVKTANARRLKLMVGHVLEHHPAVEALDRLIRHGCLGAIQRVVSFRFGPSAPRHEGAWWSLAPHDIGLARRFFAQEPSAVCVRRLGAPTGECYSASLHFGNGVAELEVGCGHPRKIRRTLVLGTHGAAEVDDCRPGEQLRLLDVAAALAEHPPAVEIPGVRIPVAPGEPLAREAAAFVRGVLYDEPFSGDGLSGYRVTAALEAGTRSLEVGHAVSIAPSLEHRLARPPAANP
jgi:UDP-2-acetamido-3-amino-2,3-dideoxy-glucuronate N-acetyltransferase